MGSKINIYGLQNKEKIFLATYANENGQKCIGNTRFFFCDKIFMSNYDRAQANQPPITWTP